MELKDWGYIAAFVLTFAVSLAALIVNIKNRKNAIREHLYKEQFSCFLELSKELATLSGLFDDIEVDGEMSEEQETEIEKQIRIIEKQVDLYYFIMPDGLLKGINDVLALARKTHNYFNTPGVKIKINDSDKFFEVYSELMEDIREFIGVDALSEENIKLIGIRKPL